MTSRIYAIGDVHGQLSMLETALERIEQDGGAEAPLVFVGDLVDRGPDCRGVVDLVAKGIANGRDWTVIKGNHDRMFEWFLNEPYPKLEPHLLFGYHWFHEKIGGVETLASYGVEACEGRRIKEIGAEARAAVPESHKALLRNMKLFHQVGDYLFVHAGLRPGIAFDDQDEEDMLWIRQEFHDYAGSWPWIIVHGHTPVKYPRHYGNRINLDGGSGYGRPLLPARLDQNGCWLLTETGPELLDVRPVDAE